ncbi:MAG: hypothetical protein V1909_05875 [Candidatus Micrarchaeota archaeon]
MEPKKITPKVSKYALILSAFFSILSFFTCFRCSYDSVFRYRFVGELSLILSALFLFVGWVLPFIVYRQVYKETVYKRVYKERWILLLFGILGITALLFVSVVVPIVLASVLFIASVWWLRPTQHVQEYKEKWMPLLFGIAPVLFIIFSVSCFFGIGDCLPSELCTMPAGMTCSKSYLSSQTDTINVTLVNGLQKTIVITNISCSKNPSQFEPTKETTVSLGSAASFTTTCNDDTGDLLKFEPGDLYSGKINVEYYFQDEGPGAKRKISGNVYARVS